MNAHLTEQTTHVPEAVVSDFVAWLDRFGETSYDHQSYFAGPIGRWAKLLYYRHRLLGIAAVAPMIASEALLPSARALFWRKQRFPIADAHYAMGFFMLARRFNDEQYHARGVHFLGELEKSRSPGYRHYAWGYPFDWVTQRGVMPAGTPFITSTPYMYEAFEAAYVLDAEPRWLAIMQSIAEHAFLDFRDRVLSPNVASAGYYPADTEGGVVNASAYRAFLLTSAALRFSREDYRKAAERNLNFVLESQRADGSWPYAMDGVRSFVDHFHTCFVMKALAKIDRLANYPGCRRAIENGVNYYARSLFDEDGLPKPFAVAPRLTVYRQELYDYAECLNLATLLRGRYTELDRRFESTLTDLLRAWRKPDGSFRARRLLMGWDNVPMHRWAQSQVFRSLCQILAAEPRGDAAPEPWQPRASPATVVGPSALAPQSLT